MAETQPTAADLSPERWEAFFERYCREPLLRVASRYPESRSLYVEFPTLVRFDPGLADALLQDPDGALERAHEGLRRMALPGVVSLDGIHLRFTRLPGEKPGEGVLVDIRELRSHHISRLISVRGMVRQAQEVRPRLVEAAFECSRCRHVTRVPQSGGRFREPLQCENETCQRRGPFKLRVAQSKFVDAQKLRIEESPEELRGGAQPQKLPVEVEDDLVEAGVTPGDRVRVNGILRSYQRMKGMEKSTTFDLSLEGLSIEMEEKEFGDIEITEEEEREIEEMARDPRVFERVVKSIAPSIYGYDAIKEAIALQLFSGIAKNLPDGARIRGDIHILLVGDPGTAKSMLLRYVTHLAPRAVYTSGRGSTAAGLTAAAIRDEEGRWVLEAGALVIADNGVAAVDEMDKMLPEDRSALHEALEQQTISIAKAGITATLKSRCSLLAAANPKSGRFNLYDPIAAQLDLPPGLLSRFDLIFQLTDLPDEAEDTRKADHILHSHYAGELAAAGQREAAAREMVQVHPDIEPERLRKYIAHSKTHCFPVMSPEALQRFRDFYVNLRKSGGEETERRNAPVAVTARQLEALVRLGEASARARLGREVTLEDAERVIALVTRCLKEVGMDMETGRFDADLINVGFSKTTRDRMRTLRDILRSLGAHERAVDRAQAEEEAAGQGIDKDRARKIIEDMLRNGELYEPAKEKGKVRFAGK
ncbi:MAG: minichromosome maintenance protein MCM [Euryarchaeota archaeon]|nr:minichromosome maintenance protein MCM [Euryarchaeota archaeon]